jgi:hypothetical protein
MPQPQQHSTVSPLTTFLIAAFCLLALFPGLFVSVFWAPYNQLTHYLVPAAAPRHTVLCTSPNICGPAMSWYVCLRAHRTPRSPILKTKYLLLHTGC